MINGQHETGNGDALHAMTTDELRHALQVTALALRESRQDAMSRDAETERCRAALVTIAKLGGDAGALATKALS